MDFDSAPGRGPATPLRSQPSNTGIARIDFAVISRADCGLAWKIFSQCEEWNRFLSAYGKIQWFGERWAPGSRLQIELTYPAPLVQDRVITICNPPRCVAWINHVMGFTMEQWVLFDPAPAGGTRISTWIEFTGEALHVDGHDVQAIVRGFVERWYTNFAAELDRMSACV